MEQIKQTAVNWLEAMVESKLSQPMSTNFKELFEQAKAMEKEQKIQAQLDVLYNALNSNNVKLSVEQTITELINGTILQRNIRR